MPVGEAPRPPSGRIVLTAEDDTVELRELIPEDAERYFHLVDTNREHLSQYGGTTSSSYNSVDDVSRSIVSPPNPEKKGLVSGTVM